eukprot:jgi/Astpho2/4494/Aster-00094
MFNGPAPVRAMRDIERLHLFPAVFPVSEAAAAKLPEDYGRPGVHTMAAAAAILKGTWRPQELQTAEVARLTLLAALLLPLRSCQVQDKKGKQHPVTAEVVGEGMKWPKKMASNTAALHAEAPGLLQTYKALQDLGSEWEQQAPNELRSQLGLAVRKLKDLWPAGLVLASLLPMPEARQLGVDAAQADSQSADDEAGSPQMQLGHEDALAARWGG